jgi:hypothetical protein
MHHRSLKITQNGWQTLVLAANVDLSAIYRVNINLHRVPSGYGSLVHFVLFTLPSCTPENKFDLLEPRKSEQYDHSYLCELTEGNVMKWKVSF